MDFWPYWLSVAGMAFGAVLGVLVLLDPRWVAGVVRLKEDGPGGFSEFRATFGGLFLASQAVGIAFMVAVALEIESLSGVPTLWTALGASAVCAAMWIGTGLARILSIALDGTGTAYHRIAVGVELVLGSVILLPWFFGH